MCESRGIPIAAELRFDLLIRIGGVVGWTAPFGIIRTDYTSAELRSLSGRCSDGAQVRRLLALALVLDAYSRTEAEALNGMDRQTLSDWVHRYNVLGVEGLKSRGGSGRTPALSESRMAEPRELVIQGPDPEIHKVVRWGCVDLQAEVVRRFSVHMHENTIGRWPHEMGLTRLQPRPVHPQKDPEAEATFKKTSPIWSEKRSVRPRSAVR
jgi:transposase